MATPTDRKNHLVWDALEAGQPKQALTLINRRLKKGEKSDHLLVLKAHVLSLQPGGTGVEEAEGVCCALAEAGGIEDVETLGFLGRVWAGLEGKGGSGGVKVAEERRAGMARLWEAAVRKRSADERLAKEWFMGAVRGGDWRVAQKAAMHLQKAFPKRREYYFWAVVSCILLHNTLPESAPDRKLFGMLAYRMIIKAKDETPPEADNILIPPRAIHTAQDIHLLLTIIESASPAPTPLARSIEALAVVDSKNLGLESKIGKGDYLGLLRRKLALLKDVGRWNVLWELCGGLLKTTQKPEDGEKKEKTTDLPEIGDDWTLWESYLTAAGELFRGGKEVELPEGKDVVGVKGETLEVINSYLNATAATGARNSELAMVKFASLFHGKDAEALLPPPEGTPSLVDACERYFEKVGSKTCCFEDLGRYVDRFSHSEQEEFLAFLNEKEDVEKKADPPTPGSVARRINVQKFTYFLKISPLPFEIPPVGDEEGLASAMEKLGISEKEGKVEDVKSAIVNTLSTFAMANLKLYVSSLVPALSSTLIVTDNQYGDDAALLSVMALLRLWKLDGGRSETNILRAIVVLETVLKKSKHNYQALLLLTRLYILVGAPYLASGADCWGRLSVKQVQTDTLGHWLLTRCSTIFPLPPGGVSSAASQASLYKPQFQPGAAAGTGDRDVAAALQRCLRIYESSRKQTPDMLCLALEKGSFGQVGEFVEFGRRLERSVAREVFEIEGRRVGRLRNAVGGGTGVEGLQRWAEERVPEVDGLVDNRDLGVLVNFERPGVGRFEERVLRVGGKSGALQGGKWVRAFSFVEVALSTVSKGTITPEARTALGKYAEEIGKIVETSRKDGGVAGEFTQEELSYLDICSLLFRMVTAPAAAEGEKLLDDIEARLGLLTPTQTQSPTTVFTWNTLHTHHLILDATLLLRTFLPLIKTPSATTKIKTMQSTTIPALVKDAGRRLEEVLEAGRKVEEDVVGEVLGGGGSEGCGEVVLERALREIPGSAGDVDTLRWVLVRVWRSREEGGGVVLGRK